MSGRQKGVFMEIHSLERLEERVSKAIELMNQFREEKEELQNQNRVLTAQIREYEKTLERLDAENKQFRAAHDRVETSYVQQEEIKKRIEGMLSKLDDL